MKTAASLVLLLFFVCNLFAVVTSQINANFGDLVGKNVEDAVKIINERGMLFYLGIFD